MLKSLRFQLQFALPNLGVVALVGAAVLLLAAVTGVPQGRSDFFSMYVYAFGLMVPMILYFLAANSTAGILKLGLSFGARRRDYFPALQIVLVLYTLAGWAMECFVASLPDLLRWAESPYKFPFFHLGDPALWPYPVLCFAGAVLGCCAGIRLPRSTTAGALLLVGGSLLLMAGVIALAFGAGLKIQEPSIFLPEAIGIGAAIAAAAGEIILWRGIRKISV